SASGPLPSRPRRRSRPLSRPARAPIRPARAPNPCAPPALPRSAEGGRRFAHRRRCARCSLRPIAPGGLAGRAACRTGPRTGRRTAKATAACSGGLLGGGYGYAGRSPGVLLDIESLLEQDHRRDLVNNATRRTLGSARTTQRRVCRNRAEALVDEADGHV